MRGKVTPTDLVEVYDENSATNLMPPVNRKRRGMIGRGFNAPNWTDKDEAVLINIMFEEAKQHNFIPHTIGGKGWKDMAKRFWIETGKADRYDTEAIRQKYQRLRLHFRNFQHLLSSCSGYAWDPDNNTVVVDECVWREHLKKYPHHRPFKFHGPRHYDVLSKIFDEHYATGALAHSSVQLQPSHRADSTVPKSEPETHSIDGVAQGIHVGPTSTNVSGDDIPLDSQMADKGKHSMGESSHNPCRKKSKSGHEEVIECFQDYTHKRNGLLERWKKTQCAIRANDAHPPHQCDHDPYSPPVVTFHLQHLAKKYEFPPRLVIRTLNELKDPTTRQMFLCLSEELQVYWVQELGNN